MRGGRHTTEGFVFKGAVGVEGPAASTGSFDTTEVARVEDRVGAVNPRAGGKWNHILDHTARCFVGLIGEVKGLARSMGGDGSHIRRVNATKIRSGPRIGTRRSLVNKIARTKRVECAEQVPRSRDLGDGD